VERAEGGGATGAGSAAAADDPSHAPKPITVLDGRPEPLRVLLSRAWAARELAIVLARKEFFVRYRRATLGLAWSAGLPLLQAIVLALVFQHVVRFDTGSAYAPYVLSGMVVVSYVTMTVGTAATSIVDGSSLTSRTYFPRLILPLVTVLSNVVSLVVTLVALMGVCLFDGVGLGPEVLLLIPGAVLTVVLTAAFGLVLSAAHVYARDVRYVVAAVTTLALYVTPVVYPLSFLPTWLRLVVVANPMTGVVEVMRAATVGADGWWPQALAATGVWLVVLLVVGAELHRRRDRLFADLL
jgi:lipopolysaccharide transport system permease protein